MKNLILYSTLLASSLILADKFDSISIAPWKDLKDNICQQNVNGVKEYLKTVDIENIPDDIREVLLELSKYNVSMAIQELHEKINLNHISFKSLLISLKSARKLASYVWTNSLIQMTRLITYTTAITIAINILYYIKDKNEGYQKRLKKVAFYSPAIYGGLKVFSQILKAIEFEESTTETIKLNNASLINYIIKKEFAKK